MRFVPVALGLALIAVLGCANPTPSEIAPPAVTPAAPAVSTSTAAPAATPAVVVPLAVDFGGTIHCATFPYACRAVLTVLPPGTTTDAEWRPSPADPWWGPDWSGGSSVDHLDPAPIGALPVLSPGPHQLTISLLGSSDIQSYTPDGSIAEDLLSRCATVIEVGPGTTASRVRVIFEPDGVSFGGRCRIEPVAD